MVNGRIRYDVDGDDSLLSSLAGVPLTRVARVGLCSIWLGFGSLRVFTTTALDSLSQLQLRPFIEQLMGRSPFDQGFSLCMLWLSFEVTIILWSALAEGAMMLIAKTPKKFSDMLLERLPLEQLEDAVKRRQTKVNAKLLSAGEQSNSTSKN